MSWRSRGALWVKAGTQWPKPYSAPVPVVSVCWRRSARVDLTVKGEALNKDGPRRHRFQPDSCCLFCPPSLVCLRVWEEASTGPRRGAPTHSWSPRSENRSCAVVFRALSAPWQTTAEPPQPFPQATSKMKSGFIYPLGILMLPF